MQTPNVFLAYAPRGPGLRCAVAYLTSGRDVYGWFTGPRLDLATASCYFVIADFFTGAPAAAEFEAYREAELAAPGEVNVRFERLSRFSTLQPNWTYYSPGFAASVLWHLAKRWPLEYRLDLEQAESP